MYIYTQYNIKIKIYVFYLCIYKPAGLEEDEMDCEHSCRAECIGVHTVKWCHNCLTNRLSSITRSFSFQRLRICLWVFVRIRRFFTKKSSSLFRSSLFKRAQKTQNTKSVKRVIYSLCLKTSNYHKNPNSEFPTPDFSLQKGAKPTNWNLWHMGINSRYVLPENSNLVLDF